MSKIRAIIIDDEPKAIAVLERYCNDLDSVELKSSFRDPVKAIEYLQSQNTDIIFLDINMPKISGLEFLDILSKRPRIIFTTAYTEYALESYDYEAVDYLLKPIDFHRFVKAISKAQKLISLEKPSNTVEANEDKNDKIIYIKSGPKLNKVNISDILYLEKDGNYLMFFTKDKKMLSRQNMKDVFEILNPKEFIRVHKSYVVALKHIEIIEPHQIRIGEIKLPIGRHYKDNLTKITQNSTH